MSNTARTRGLVNGYQVRPIHTSVSNPIVWIVGAFIVSASMIIGVAIGAYIAYDRGHDVGEKTAIGRINAALHEELAKGSGRPFYIQGIPDTKFYPRGQYSGVAYKQEEK